MCEQYKYKGFIIYHNEGNDKFSHPYISIVNPNIKFANGKNPHCHIVGSDRKAKQIIDCAIDYENVGYSFEKNRIIRNKAMRLNGMYITYRQE